MEVQILDRAMVDSDLGAVNAARCSFGKESGWLMYHSKGNECEIKDCTETRHWSRVLNDRDTKLLLYLATHEHWTPFAHAQEIVELPLSEGELLYFLSIANLSGFEWIDSRLKSKIKMKGSLYAWLRNMHFLPAGVYNSLSGYLYGKYPVSYKCILGDFIQGSSQTQEHVSIIDYEDALELQPFTLRISCPIFVKRQLETHRRGFTLTDMSDFSQNEVSRRYITTRPDVYVPESWYLQHKDKKQGSSDEILSGIEEYIQRSNYTQHTHNALMYYENALERGVSAEQARMFLPLSTYTTFWWTGSRRSWERVFTLRLKDNVQHETREIIQMCYDIIDV